MVELDRQSLERYNSLFYIWQMEKEKKKKYVGHNCSHLKTGMYGLWQHSIQVENKNSNTKQKQIVKWRRKQKAVNDI